MHTCIHTCVHHTYIHTYIQNTHANIHTYIYTHAYTHTYVHIYVSCKRNTPNDVHTFLRTSLHQAKASIRDVWNHRIERVESAIAILEKQGFKITERDHVHVRTFKNCLNDVTFCRRGSATALQSDVTENEVDEDAKTACVGDASVLESIEHDTYVSVLEDPKFRGHQLLKVPVCPFVCLSILSVCLPACITACLSACPCIDTCKQHIRNATTPYGFILHTELQLRSHDHFHTSP
jgi:hypothetical protein